MIRRNALAQKDTATGNRSSSGSDAGQQKSLPEWYKPRIDRQDLKALIKRNNYRAFFSHGLWFVSLGITGYLAVITYGTWWCVPAFFVYGTIFATCNARWHESSHGTPFKTQFLNEIVYFISAAGEFRDIVFTRWSHTNHHSYTIITDRDLEIADRRPLKMWKLWLDFFHLKTGPYFIYMLIAHSLGIPTKDPKRVVPEGEFRKMFWAARGCLGLHIAVIVFAIVIRSWIPVLLFTLPRFYGGILVWLFILTQHAGLAQDVWDHRLSTRTVYLNPIFSFLYMHMEYHIEHHIFPNVPFHALPRLHEKIKDQLPRTYSGLWDVFKEQFPALLKQRHDANYYIRRELPEPASSL